MTIKAGDKMPAGAFKFMSAEGPKEISTDALFGGKTVVLFSVPGAFTPTCDARHLPGFVQHADAFKAKGVDTIACMAVNDMFVMNAWGKASNVGDKVMMLADGNGEYSRALGLELDARGFGLGMRGQRMCHLFQLLGADLQGRMGGVIVHPRGPGGCIHCKDAACMHAGPPPSSPPRSDVARLELCGASVIIRMRCAVYHDCKT